MEDCYGPQARIYDSFRDRLLHGRREMIGAINAPPGATWVDMGAGTGWNLECLGEQIKSLGNVYLVDVSPSMLNVVRDRIRQHGWNNVEAVQADALQFQPACGLVDIVTFSYSLTMIPDWFAAIEHAWSILKPGGLIGVADFYVSRKHPDAGMKRHSRFTRAFWPTWFDRGNIFSSADHVPYLHRRFRRVEFREGKGRIAYLPLLRVPYYIFVGLKGEDALA